MAPEMGTTGVATTGAVMQKTIPIGVKIISILFYLVSAGMIFSAITLMVSGIAIPIPGLGLLGSATFIVGGIILVALGVFGLFVGRGLWKGKNWTRIVAIIFMAVYIISGIISLIQGVSIITILFVLIYAFIAGYLLFSSKVKAAFA